MILGVVEIDVRSHDVDNAIVFERATATLQRHGRVMHPVPADVKIALTVLAAGGWVVMLVQASPNWSAIGVGLLGITAGGGLWRIVRREAEMRRKARKNRRLIAVQSLPQRLGPPLVPLHRLHGGYPGDVRPSPEQRWHRSGGRARRSLASPGS